jgi:hypothetical protein
MKTNTTTTKCILLGIIYGLTFTASAVIKNEPDEDIVVEDLKELGEKHWHKDMDVDEFGSLRVEDPATGDDTYFHIFFSYLNEEYRVIIYDNNEQYLGYYKTPLEPVDMEEGAVLVDSGDGSSYYKLPVTTEEFPERMRLGLNFVNFIKNQQLKRESAPVAKAESGSEESADKPANDSEPEYRTWTVSINNKDVTFNAVFVKNDGPQIYLKESKRGLENNFSYQIFSEKDQTYLKDLLLNQE